MRPDGVTPLLIAIHFGPKEIATLLRNAGEREEL